ncbi:hypothetical protein M9H77_02291 [Catharanthus roseus]|uniref:Uncharacterized protein n=1 Tax=Catharanthus roseus TaxID=4058 RepID=A0ACC0C7Z0_CATRO|nr:hypothetical protein M9H77_02291 [Catharanthus roseus]
MDIFLHNALIRPNSRVMTIQEDISCVSSSNKEDDDDKDMPPMMEGSEEECEAKEGQCFVSVCARCSQVNIEEEQKQRHKLFHTMGRVKDKICLIIINSGSCTNIASIYLVENLQLPTIKHPTPYILKWLNKCGEIKVSKQAKVAFTIGKYEDEVLCDKVLVDTSHLLLGWPWEFDRNANHEGFSNNLKSDILPSIAKMTHSSKMVVACTVVVPLRRFKIHWKAQRTPYMVTKNPFERFDGQTKLITKEMQNRNRKAKIETTSDGRLHPTILGRNLGYGNFSPHARFYEHNSYDCYEGNRLGTKNGHNDRTYNRGQRNEVRNEGNYVNMDGRFHKRRGDYKGYYDSYSYGGYNCRRSSQTLGTTSRPLSSNNFKLPLLCGTFGSYDYVAWESKK